MSRSTLLLNQKPKTSRPTCSRENTHSNALATHNMADLLCADPCILPLQLFLEFSGRPTDCEKLSRAAGGGSNISGVIPQA